MLDDSTAAWPICPVPAPHSSSLTALPCPHPHRHPATIDGDHSHWKAWHKDPFTCLHSFDSNGFCPTISSSCDLLPGLLNSVVPPEITGQRCRRKRGPASSEMLPQSPVLLLQSTVWGGKRAGFSVPQLALCFTRCEIGFDSSFLWTDFVCDREGHTERSSVSLHPPLSYRLAFFIPPVSLFPTYLTSF